MRCGWRLPESKKQPAPSFKTLSDGPTPSVPKIRKSYGIPRPARRPATTRQPRTRRADAGIHETPFRLFRHRQTRACPPVPPVFQRRRQTDGRLGFCAPLLGRPAPRIAIRRARIPEKNAAAPDPAGHPSFADADYRKIMVGQLRRTRPHCRQHRPAPPRSQHRPIGMEYARQHLAAPRRYRPPTAPQTAHRHRAAGKNHLQQSGTKRIFHQQSHRLIGC